MNNYELALQVAARAEQARANELVYEKKMSESQVLLHLRQFLVAVTGSSAGATIIAGGSLLGTIVFSISFFLGEFIKSFKISESYDAYKNARQFWGTTRAQLKKLERMLQFMPDDLFQSPLNLQLFESFMQIEQQILAFQPFEPPFVGERNLKILEKAQKQAQREIPDSTSPRAQEDGNTHS